MSELLSLLTKNERPWGIRSGHSPRMSDHEGFAQGAQRKWAIESESLKSLTKNEQMSESLIFLANRSFAHFGQKRAIRSENRWVNSQPWYEVAFKYIFLKKRRVKHFVTHLFFYNDRVRPKLKKPYFTGLSREAVPFSRKVWEKNKFFNQLGKEPLDTLSLVRFRRRKKWLEVIFRSKLRASRDSLKFCRWQNYSQIIYIQYCIKLQGWKYALTCPVWCTLKVSHSSHTLQGILAREEHKTKFTGLGIRSFAHLLKAHSLICSDRSNQMSDCEQFA